MREGWLRRRYVWYFKRHEALRNIKRRKGRCVRCGRCCGHCVFHDGARKSCRIYRHRPDICRFFPLAPEDVECIPSCGFSFGDI